jgi:hypothetical protein
MKKRRGRLNEKDMQVYIAVQSVINRFIDELARLEGDTQDIAHWAAMVMPTSESSLTESIQKQRGRNRARPASTPAENPSGEVTPIWATSSRFFAPLHNALEE